MLGLVDQQLSQLTFKLTEAAFSKRRSGRLNLRLTVFFTFAILCITVWHRFPCQDMLAGEYASLQR